jgi:hypothetical protein
MLLQQLFCAFCNLLNSRDAWDMAAEICLSKLPHLIDDPNVEFQVIHLLHGTLRNTSVFLSIMLPFEYNHFTNLSPNSNQPSPFFTEQLTAFEVWLDHGSEDKKPPEQLPIVLQVRLFLTYSFVQVNFHFKTEFYSVSFSCFYIFSLVKWFACFPFSYPMYYISFFSFLHLEFCAGSAESIT